MQSKLKESEMQQTQQCKNICGAKIAMEHSLPKPATPVPNSKKLNFPNCLVMEKNPSPPRALPSEFREGSEMQKKPQCNKNSNAEKTATQKQLQFGRRGLQTSHPSPLKLSKPPKPPPANSKKLKFKLKGSALQKIQQCKMLSLKITFI